MCGTRWTSNSLSFQGHIINSYINALKIPISYFQTNLKVRLSVYNNFKSMIIPIGRVWDSKNPKPQTSFNLKGLKIALLR